VAVKRAVFDCLRQGAAKYQFCRCLLINTLKVDTLLALASVSTAAEFTPSDVQAALLKSTSGGAGDYSYFRFLDGSGLTSPRCRDGGCNCVVLQCLDGTDSSWYLIRTAHPTSGRDPLGSIRHTYRFHVVRNFVDPRPIVSYDWVLVGRRRLVDNWNNNDGEQTTGLPPVGHFETYAADQAAAAGARRRRLYAIVVGPPHVAAPSSECPTTCVVDVQRSTMQAVDIKLPVCDRRRHRPRCWVANAVFDPRPSRDHIAAILCCVDPSDFLPRADLQTGSLALYDVRRRLVLCSTSDDPTVYSSARLQYVGGSAENQLAVVSVTCPPVRGHDATSGFDDASYIALLSPDDLTVTRRLPVSTATSKAVGSFCTTMYSVDCRQMAIVWRDRDRKLSSAAGDVIGDAALSPDNGGQWSPTAHYDVRSRDLPPPPGSASASVSAFPTTTAAAALQQQQQEQLRVAIYRMRPNVVPSLVRLCSVTVLQTTADGGPAPSQPFSEDRADCRRRIQLLPLPSTIKQDLMAIATAATDL
jgi:hypothetical protein